MATVVFTAHSRPPRVPVRQRVKDFGRGLTYQIAGLPIAERHTIGRPGHAPQEPQG